MVTDGLFGRHPGLPHSRRKVYTTPTRRLDWRMPPEGGTPMILAVPASPPLFASPRDVAVAVPDLSIVIVNYQRWTETDQLVRQLLSSRSSREGRAEVVVVDNHSPYHPAAARLRRTPAVSLRRWGRNRGFARAANEGCRLSRGRWFLLLNPDIRLPDGFVED